MKRFRNGFWLAALLLPGLVAGQEGVRVDVTPQAGVYVPLRDLGAAAPAAAAWYLRLGRMDVAMTVGARAELRWRESPLGIRVGVQYVLPSKASGIFHCYPGQACPSILLRSDADITLWSGVAEAVWRLGAAGAVRPYVVAGGGVQRYRYKWPDAAALVEAGEHTETPVTVRGGAGADVRVRGTVLWFELGGFWTQEGSGLRSAQGLHVAGRRSQTDLSIVAGWRLLRF